MKSSRSKNLLLLDGLGALLSGFLHSVFLVKFDQYIGMPHSILYGLAVVAFLYALFSLLSYFFLSQNWSKNLKTIAIANLLFCLTSGILVFLNFASLGKLGLIYFVGEILLISILATFELKVAREDNLNPIT